MEVWRVYSQRLQNYSHFAAFNQWLPLSILNPSLLSSLPYSLYGSFHFTEGSFV